jgi:hypothetical protein
MVHFPHTGFASTDLSEVRIGTQMFLTRWLDKLMNPDAWRGSFQLSDMLTGLVAHDDNHLLF